MSEGARRTPKQRRSTETRGAIVEAAARVFAELGLERATIARIAEVAGVSPGSMYQYFASKDALIVAILERETETQQRMLIELASRLGTEDLPALVRAFVGESLVQLESKRALNRVLLHEVPRLSGLAISHSIDVAAARSVRLLFELGRSRLVPRDLDLAALLVVRAFRYTTIALLEEPLPDDRRAAFVDELSDLLLAYLLLPRTWRGGVL